MFDIKKSLKKIYFPQKARKYEAVRWVMVFVIGVTVGLVGRGQPPPDVFAPRVAVRPNLAPLCLLQVGLFVDFFVHLFTKIKFSLVGDCIL